MENDNINPKEKAVIDAIIDSNIMDDEGIINHLQISQEEYENIKASLIEKSIIKNIVALNAKNSNINKKICIFHFYKCRGGPQQISATAKLFEKLHYIEEVHSIVGEYDLLVKFRVRDMDEYNKILNKEIWTTIEAAGITNSMGIMSIQTYFEKTIYLSELEQI